MNLIQFVTEEVISGEVTYILADEFADEFADETKEANRTILQQG